MGPAHHICLYFGMTACVRMYRRYILAKCTDMSGTVTEISISDQLYCITHWIATCVVYHVPDAGHDPEIGISYPLPFLVCMVSDPPDYG